MHLKALRLKGFKSFPKQTELLFEPGVAVIIGPNGSGKSNVADASCGRSGASPSTVRGSSMQDVIFAGSDGRRASGSAEVELTFDNADGELPLPTAEVSVMRRVTRDGSSQYFINQSGCRLTDVVELMAQVGLGKELHSIIGQGKVESFLAGKPEDRRNQIEEAAGLGAFKRRRERAQLKVREVRRNLERADLWSARSARSWRRCAARQPRRSSCRTVEADLAETRGRLLTGEVARSTQSWRRARPSSPDCTRSAPAVTKASPPWRPPAPAKKKPSPVASRSANGVRSACCARACSTGAWRAGAGSREQRLRLLEEVQRASAEERERLLGELAGRPEEADEDGWPREEQRLVEALAAAEAGYAEIAGALGGARDLLGEKRASLSRLTLERESALTMAARLERRQEALAGEEARLGAHYEAALAEGATGAGAEEAAMAAEKAAHAALREAAAAAEAATGVCDRRGAGRRGRRGPA